MSGALKIGILLIALFIGTVLVFKLIERGNSNEPENQINSTIEKSQLKLKTIVSADHCAYGIDYWNRVYFICGEKAKKVYLDSE
jgi:hypothetical protein